MITARGKIISEEEMTTKVLLGKLNKLRKLENQVLNTLISGYEGVTPSISADGIANWSL